MSVALHRRMPRIGFLVSVTTLVLCAWPVRAQTGVIEGDVHDKVASVVLPFSGISVIGSTTERLTNADGKFRLGELAPGVVRLRIRHVGFSPLDTQVAVRAGDTTHLSVRLARIPVTLAAVRVTDDVCLKPGPPSASEPDLLAVFEQLQLNAEQFRLVTTQYPFNSLVERRYSRLALERARTPKPGSNGADTVEIVSRIDSVVVQSDRTPRYKPGEIIVLERVTPLGAQYGMTIPNLAVFADQEFVKHHCFQDGGNVDVGGQTYRRVDFRAAEDIRDPDVDGSMYLDPETFAIRRSEVSLSRRSRFTSSYDAVIVETTFDELVPGVPVITATNGRSILTPEAGRPSRAHPLPDGGRFISELEGQVAREIRFAREAPGMSDSAANGKRAPSVIRLDGSAGRRRVLGVFDAESGAPVAGVVVRDSASGRSASTTATGTVGLGFIPHTTGVVSVEHAGYERQTIPVSLTLTDTLPVTIILRRARVPR
jgi:Carboxypeptidase regulatory-like domain